MVRWFRGWLPICPLQKPPPKPLTANVKAQSPMAVPSGGLMFEEESLQLPEESFLVVPKHGE